MQNEQKHPGDNHPLKQGPPPKQTAPESSTRAFFVELGTSACVLAVDVITRHQVPTAMQASLPAFDVASLALGRAAERA
jgi:hypothetical protein